MVLKISTTNALKTASKRTIQKIAEPTGDLIGNKMADKIKSVSKKSSKELHSNKTNNANNESPPKKDIYLQKKDNKLLIN